MGQADDQGGGGHPFWKVGSMKPTAWESWGLLRTDHQGRYPLSGGRTRAPGFACPAQMPGGIWGLLCPGCVTGACAQPFWASVTLATQEGTDARLEGRGRIHWDEERRVSAGTVSSVPLGPARFLMPLLWCQPTLPTCGAGRKCQVIPGVGPFCHVPQVLSGTVPLLPSVTCKAPSLPPPPSYVPTLDHSFWASASAGPN